MKAGSGKLKGGNFERKIARQLSLWVTQGTNENGLWRSSSSGATATINKKKGDINIYQCGDLCAVSPDCYAFAEKFYVELKSYKDLNIANFVFGRASILDKFWKLAKKEAKEYDKEPLLIAKQNNFPELIIFKKPALQYLLIQHKFDKVAVKGSNKYVGFLDEFLTAFILKPNDLLQELVDESQKLGLYE